VPEDARYRFDEDVFNHRVTRDGKVLISWQGRLVTTVAGKAADQLIDRLERADRRETQHLLARATGNFRRGNEREGKMRRQG
jgi:hypothetical protein